MGVVNGSFLRFGTLIFEFLVSFLIPVAIFKSIGPISNFRPRAFFDPPPAETVGF